MADLFIMTLLIIATLLVLALGTLIVMSAVTLFRYLRRKKI